MSRETRTVRPFVGLGKLPKVLEQAVIYFGQEACAADRTIAVDLDPHEFLRRQVSLEWCPDDSSFERFRETITSESRSAGFSLDDLSLVAVGTSSYIKSAAMVFERPASEIEDLPRLVTLTDADRPEPFSAPFTGFIVDLYLLLSRDLPRNPLKPYLRGTWIASSRHRITTTKGPALLPPTPLTAEVRKKHGLPERTIRFIYFGDHDVTEDYTRQEQPVFYIDEKLLAQMNARGRSQVSKALQLQLALDFIAAVVRRASMNPELRDMSYNDVRGSLVGRVLRISAGPGANEEHLSNLMGLMCEDAESVVVRAEHHVDVGKGFIASLEDGEE